MLIVALVLSCLNAITGTARSLHQMSTDGNFPKIFSRLNRHGVPAAGMFFTVICSIAVVFMGGAVQIYTYSNVGYLIIMIPVLVGYWYMRQHRPNLTRPIRLPGFMKYVALAMAAFFLLIYVYGADLRLVYVLPGRQVDPAVLLPRVRGARHVLTPVSVAQAGRGQARRRDDAAGAGDVKAMATEVSR